MTLADRARRLAWRWSTRPLDGVRAIVTTPAGAVVLVRQSYTRGWHLPAGGRKPAETAEAAMRRELAEEIGLTAGSFAEIARHDGMLGRRPHRYVTFRVRDAAYRPRWTLEIEEVAAFPPDALPAALDAATAAALRQWLATASER